MTLDRILDERYSCRAFLPTPVPQAVLEGVFRKAQRTASWCNTQPWQVTVTSGAATERIRAALLSAHAAGSAGETDFEFPAGYQGVSLQRRRTCGQQLYGAVGISRGDKEGAARQSAENFRLFGAPHLAVLTSDEQLGVYGAVDTGGYLQVLMLLMQSRGIVAIAQAALARHCSLLRSELHIGMDRKVVCAVSFGYADTAHPANSFRTERADLAAVVNWVDDRAEEAT